MSYATKLLPLLLLLCVSTLHAKIDSLVMGPQYANQVWYSLSSGVHTTSLQSNWDIAFEVTSTSGTTASVIVNEGKGAKVYVVPDATIEDWETIDTTGLSTWTPLHNSVTTLSDGALNQARDANNEFDFGWGAYSLVSHQILGTNVFVYQNAEVTFKLRVDGLIGGAYQFTYSHLDGSNEHSGEIAKASYANKLFAYWSFDNHAAVDREPALTDWDFTMLKYVDMIPAGPGTVMAYPVTGILTSPLAKAAKVITATPSTEPAPASELLLPDANTIGWDWKSFANGTFAVADSTVYFVLSSNNLYRLVFTSFSGGSSGVTTFSVDAVQPSSVSSNSSSSARLAVYPNVVTNGASVDIASAVEGACTLLVVDALGHVVHTRLVESGLSAMSLTTTGLASGTYSVILQSDRTITTARLVVL